MKSLAIQQLPPDLAQSLEQIGENIRRARIRRGLTQDDLARRVMVSRSTLAQLERGAPEVGMGILLRTLNALGLDQTFKDLASPEKDTVGQALEARMLPQRATRPKRLSDLLIRKAS